MNISVEYVAIIALVLLNLSLGFLYFQSLVNLKQTTKNATDLILENFVINESENFKGNEELDIHQENFVKFLSDSRDWAFDYIDKSQKQIKEFIDIADQQFVFFDSWGILCEGQLFYETMKTMSEEYKKLKSLLPEEADDRR
jgi:hypothetical protein